MSSARPRRRNAPREPMDDFTAAETIQAWFNGNIFRGAMEETRVEANVKNGMNGAAQHKETSRMRRRPTVRMTKDQCRETGNSGLVFFGEWKFFASLKGIVDVQGRLTEPFTLVVNMDKRNPAFDKDYTKYSNYLALHVDHEKVWFSLNRNGSAVAGVDLSEMSQLVESKTPLGLEPDVITTYWLSYDRDNMVLKYGKGYAMEQTTLLICDFSEGMKTAEDLARKREVWSMFFGIYNPERKDVTLLLYRTQSDIDKHKEKEMDKGQKAGFIHVEPLVEVRKEPLVVNPSPFVIPSSKSTLNLIDKNQYIFSSELPPACKRLYDTVINCELDMEFESGVADIRLSDAVRYSMTTEGCVLHELLKTKAYLRITVGPSAKESPGIPYVLEFWPPGSRSPVHNHGSVCAIIKIVYGTIQNGTFNKMPSSVYDEDSAKAAIPEELMKFDAYKGDVMWMSPEWFQTHQLRNVSNDFCASINCYRYDDDDNIQWNLFDYVNDENGQMGNFFPNTDYTFGEMRDLVTKEWNERH